MEEGAEKGEMRRKLQFPLPHQQPLLPQVALGLQFAATLE